MDVTIPEAGNNGLSGAIDNQCTVRNLNVASAADSGDEAIRHENDCIQERSCVRRRIDLPCQENE